MKLKTKQLKEFFSVASSITVNNILPILAYIKLENAALTKTNLANYVVHKIDAPADEALLFDEKILSAFLKECKSEEIEVRAENKSVHLIDGKRKMRFQSADIQNFPLLPSSV